MKTTQRGLIFCTISILLMLSTNATYIDNNIVMASMLNASLNTTSPEYIVTGDYGLIMPEYKTWCPFAMGAIETPINVPKGWAGMCFDVNQGRVTLDVNGVNWNYYDAGTFYSSGNYYTGSGCYYFDDPLTGFSSICHQSGSGGINADGQLILGWVSGANFNSYLDWYQNNNLYMVPETTIYLSGASYTGKISHDGNNITIEEDLGNIILKNDTYINENLTVAGSIDENEFYGEMWFENSAGNITTINSPNISVKINLTNSDFNNGFVFNSTLHHLTTKKAGIYKISYDASFEGNVNLEAGFTVGVNGFPNNKTHSHNHLAVGNAETIATASSLLNLSVGDNITLMIRDEQGTPSSPRFSAAHLSLIRVGR